MRRGALSLVVLVMAALAPGVGDAGPVSVHVATGTATQDGSCGSEWIEPPCADMRQLEVAATDGDGRAIYRAGLSKPVVIDLDCVAITSNWGHYGTDTGSHLRPISDRAQIPAHSLGANGIGDDGQRYYLSLWDENTYDEFFISTTPGPFGCGGARYDGGVSFGFPSDFSITHAGNVPPLPRMSSDCDGSVCSFDATASIDADGTVELFRWNFYEGYDSWYPLGEATGPTPTFAFPANGYPKHAVLRVTDNSGDTSSARSTVIQG